jgi:hypothetical protein
LANGTLPDSKSGSLAALSLLSAPRVAVKKEPSWVKFKSLRGIMAAARRWERIDTGKSPFQIVFLGIM